jgi:hypothetical protein
VSARVRIRHFTDPACPFAFAAERWRLRLQWLYADQIEWQLHLVVLQEERPEPETWDGARFAAGRRRLFAETGMPFEWLLPLPPSATWPGSLAVSALRLRGDEAGCGRLLRELRLRAMASEAIDDDAVLDDAMRAAGGDPAQVREWMRDPQAEADLRRDMAEARSPSPAALAQDYKLGGAPEARRYSCPSYELFRLTPPPADWDTAGRVDLPGHRPVEAYETALANLAPELRRRRDPETVVDVLEWADWPLASAEVAAVCDRDLGDVRSELARSGATFRPAGGDGYWSVNSH